MIFFSVILYLNGCELLKGFWTSLVPACPMLYWPGFDLWSCLQEQLKTCTAIKGGIGMALLQKMGWNQGEGLGKNRDGTALPLMLDIKNDRKGLLAADEAKKSMTPKTVPSGIKTNLSGKHPVSALVELCSKRRWKSPEFIVVNEAGPDHQRHFMFKVRVNNWEYQPTTASNNKKLAKAEAAAVCLQELGLLPRP